MTTASTSTPPPGTPAGSIWATSVSGTICATAGRRCLGASSEADRPQPGESDRDDEVEFTKLFGA